LPRQTRTTDSKYLFGAEFSLHGKKTMPQPFAGMVNFEQVWQLLDQRLAPLSRSAYSLAGVTRIN
jgi:hypothetical protein